MKLETGNLSCLRQIRRGGKFGVIALLAFQVQAESIYTLDECIRIGLERAVPVMNAERDRQIAEATMKQARATGLPQIALTGSYTQDDGASPFASTKDGTTSGSITASQTLYNGGKVLSALRAAQAYRGLTAQAKAQQEAALVRDVTSAFNRILLAQAHVAVQEASVKQLEDFENDIRQKYDVGAASEFDWLTARVRLANEKPVLVEARNALAVAKERFRNLIVLDEEDFKLSGELSYEPFDADPVALQAMAVMSRPELLVQQRTIDLRREDLKSSWSGYKPSVTADAVYTQETPDRYGSTTDSWAAHWTAGITARWTLFDGGTRRGDVLTKGLDLAKAEANRDDLLRAVSLDVKSAWLNMMAARETITGTEENVKLAEKALEIAKVRYDEGLATTLEFTDSNLSLNTARLNYFQSLEKHLNAVVQLKYAAGILEIME